MMGLYFHEDAVQFQDRDLELPTHFFSPNVLEVGMQHEMMINEVNMDTISFTLDIPITHQIMRAYVSQNEDEHVSMPHLIKQRKHQTNVALEDVSFANPAREALRLSKSVRKNTNLLLDDDKVQRPIIQVSENSSQRRFHSTYQRSDSPLWQMIEEAFADFIGMDYLKTEIFKQASLLQVQQLRADYGIESSIKPSRHMVFQGSPGTGKTTVARVIADIYFELGLLATNNVVETDRAGLVGQYLGETAVKTAGVIESAIGGVLFIDEAYSLTEGEHNEYGKEAINTLLKMMEDHREELVVIVAGYQNEMHHFIDSNPGLKSRFNRTFEFQNYTPEELWMMLELMCKKGSYVINNEGTIKLQMLKEFESSIRNEGLQFANGRYIRNFFERLIERQSYRLVLNNQLDKRSLVELNPADFTIE